MPGPAGAAGTVAGVGPPDSNATLSTRSLTEGTVHIVDDDEAIRDALRFLVGSAGLDTRAYRDADDFLENYARARPECLLLDLRLPGMDGLSLYEELKRRGLRIPTLFLSGQGDIPAAVRALREGAMDFLEKPYANDELLDRLRAGIEADAARDRMDAEQREARGRLEALTTREMQVLDKLVEGKINKVIGAELGISTRTVESHRARVMRKLEVDSVSDLFRLVFAAGRG